MRLPDSHVGNHLEKDEGEVVELFMDLDANAIVNLMVILLLLGVLILFCRLVMRLLRRRSKAKEAATAAAAYCRLQRRRKVFPIVKRVKMSLFDLSKRKCWLKKQIQRRGSLSPNNQRSWPFGFRQGRDILSTREICLHVQGKGPISCLMPARTGLPKSFTLVQTSTSSHCFPKIRTNPISNPSQSIDNLFHNFCPSESWAKKNMAVKAMSTPNFYGCRSTNIFVNSRRRSHGWTKKCTKVQTKSLPDLYRRYQPSAKDKNASSHTCPLLTPHFARGPHSKPFYLSPKKSPKNEISRAPCLHHQPTTTSGNTKSLFCLEKFQSWKQRFLKQ